MANTDTVFRQTTARNALVGNAGTLTQLTRDFEAASLVLGDPQSGDDAQTQVMVNAISAISEALAALDGKLTAVMKTLGAPPQAPQQAQKSERSQARKWEPASKPSPYDAFNDMFDK